VTRVLWLAKGLGRGGAEQLLLGSSAYVDRSRFDVEVAYLLPWKDALVPDFVARGVKVHCLDGRRELDPRWTLRLRALVRDRSIDLLHTHMPYVAAGARLAVRDPHVRFVHTEHNLWDRYRRPTRWANMATYARNRSVIAVSEAVARTIHPPRWSAGRAMPPVEVVRHGADLASICEGPRARTIARERLAIPDEALVIGCVGNFTEKKDHATLLNACSMVMRERSDLFLVLVGTGPLEQNVRQLAGELEIDERVLFTGMRSDVYEILPALDVFSLSSRFEGLPIALLEAMATGIPAVATEVGGVPEVIETGVDGLLVPPGDPAALAAGFQKLLQDPPLRVAMGLAAAAKARRFDLRSAVVRAQEIYETALGSR
jgi:glycosyltransferase involved in cell wall biosynthesis